MASIAVAEATDKLNAKSLVPGLYLTAITLVGVSPALCTFKGNVMKT